MQIADSLVWITGASSGIGRAMAVEFAAGDARVVLSARRENLLQDVLESLGGRDDHICLPLDVTDASAVAAAARRLVRDAGTPDILVANAGIGQRGKVLHTDPSVERRIMEVNFFGVTNLVHAILPSMVRRDSGRIAVMSSVMGMIATPGHATYAASKHALHGYFEGLRSELHGSGVGITMICPGYIRTDISVSALESDGGEFGRMDAQHRDAMTPETMAEKAVNAIRRERAEVFIGGPETWAPLVKRLFPGAFRALLPRVLKRR